MNTPARRASAIDPARSLRRRLAGLLLLGPLSIGRRLTGPMLLAALLGGLASPARAQLPTPTDPEASPRWQAVKASLFGERPIGDARGVLTLEAPARAVDASAVPLAVRSNAAAAVRKLWLVIDANPSPIAAILSYAQASARADVETRVRVDEYSWVRAVAELADGRLVMAARYVKASGGCSAPAGKDAEEAKASMGRMAWHVEPGLKQGKPALAQLAISHPNDTGMVMDQLTRHYVPAHYVRRVQVSYAGQPVLDADVDFAISENPNLRFWFTPQGRGELRAEVVDTQERRFVSSLAVDPQP